MNWDNLPSVVGFIIGGYLLLGLLVLIGCFMRQYMRYLMNSEMIEYKAVYGTFFGTIIGWSVQVIIIVILWPAFVPEIFGAKS
jgi:hypothetical protein